jgi:hypothetical protein
VLDLNIQNKLGQVCALKVVLNITFLMIVNLESNKNKLIFCKVYNDRGIDLMDVTIMLKTIVLLKFVVEDYHNTHKIK